MDRPIALPLSSLRRPRKVIGEWQCRDCGHLSYGDTVEPRCPNCFGRRLAPTVEGRPGPEPRTATAS